MNLRERQSGVTIIELMVALVITSVAIAAAFGIAFSMINGYRDHRLSVSVERAARGSMDVITGALRSASPGVISGQIEDIAGCSGLRQALVVVNSSTEPDSLAVIYGSGGVLTSLLQPYDAGDAYVHVLDGSELQVGDFIIVTNIDQGHLLAIEDIRPVSGHWQLKVRTSCSVSVPTSYPATSLVIRARMGWFYIDDSGAMPVLMIDPDGPAMGSLPAEPVADGIEDLQIAVAIDRDNDLELFEDVSTTDEWHYNVPGEPGLAPPLGNDPSCSASYPFAGCIYRALRVTVSARSVGEVGTRTLSFRAPAEDRAAAGTADPFKRRTLMSTVEIRNLEGSQ